MLYHVWAIAKKMNPNYVPAGTWPVPLPESEDELDLRAQIWRYSPKNDTWECVFRSPMTCGLDDRIVPLAPSFRNMTVYQGVRDPRPAIYTITGAGSYGLGPRLLRSIDGVTFQTASEPGLELGDRGRSACSGWFCRSRAGCSYRLADVRGGHANASNTIVLSTTDPSSGEWEVHQQRTRLWRSNEPGNLRHVRDQ